MSYYGLKQILEDLAAFLNVAPSLSYIEAKCIAQYNPENLPVFEDYLIIVSPKSMGIEKISVGFQSEIVEIDVVCIVRNFDQSESLIGENPQGIIQMVGDVRTVIQGFGDNNNHRLTFLWNESGQKTQFKSFPQGKDRFFHETVIQLKIKINPQTAG